MNISNISNFEDSSSRPAFHIGAVAEIFINEKFSVQPELLYSAQGARYDYTETEIDYNSYYSKTKTETLKLDYITIPIIAKYYIVKGLNVQAGPQFAFNVTAKNHIEDIKENVKSFDFGLGLGAGYELSNGMFFDTRYNIGLSKVNKEGDASRNGVLQLSVGYKF